MSKAARTRPTTWTSSAATFIAGWGGYPLVGTPEQVAERIVELSHTGVDGSLISMFDHNQELPYFNAEVLPLLEQAGLRKPHRQRSTAKAACNDPAPNPAAV